MESINDRYKEMGVLGEISLIFESRLAQRTVIP